MATLKHIASKNSDYTAIEAYLIYQHDEFSGKVILDEQGRPMLRESYLLDTLGAGIGCDMIAQRFVGFHATIEVFHYCQRVVVCLSVAIQFTQNFLGVQPKCSQVCKFVKGFRSDLLGVRTARIEVPCKLVEVSAHLAALGKQSRNSGQGFFAAGNNDRFLDLDVVDGAADERGEGEIQEFASEFQ